jgi:anthranilate/para-aminobenzoate synthase component II
LRQRGIIPDSKERQSHVQISAETDEGEIMGIRHKELLLKVQFHRSYTDDCGKDLLRNFIKL